MGGQHAPILNPGPSRGHLRLSATAQKVPTRLVPASGRGPGYNPSSYQAQPPPLTQRELAPEEAVRTPMPPPLPGTQALRRPLGPEDGVCGRGLQGRGRDHVAGCLCNHSSLCPRPLLSIPQSGAAPWCPWAAASDTLTLWERAWGKDHPQILVQASPSRPHHLPPALSAAPSLSVCPSARPALVSPSSPDPLFPLGTQGSSAVTVEHGAPPP